MRSLTIELDDRIADALHLLANAQGRTETDILRDALSSYAGSLRPLPKGMGKYHSGQADGSEKAKEILRDAVKDGKWP